MAALVLDNLLRLLHPVMPFVTVEVWQALGAVASSRGFASLEQPADSIVVAPWPVPVAEWEDPAIEETFGVVQEVVRSVRNIRSGFGVDPKAPLDVFIDCDPALGEFLNANARSCRELARIGSLTVGRQAERPPLSATTVLPTCSLYVPLAEHIDVAAESARQEKNLASLKKRLQGVEGKLGNEKFVRNAPAEVVDQQRTLKEDLERQVAAVDAILVDLRQ